MTKTPAKSRRKAAPTSKTVALRACPNARRSQTSCIMDTPAYIVGRVTVKDWDAYGEYMKRTPKIIDQFGGRFIARGADIEALEGEPENRRMVIIEFPSVEKAKAFYHSDAYQNARQIRANAAEAQFVVLEGFPLSAWEDAVEQSL